MGRRGSGLGIKARSPRRSLSLLALPAIVSRVVTWWVRPARPTKHKKGRGRLRRRLEEASEASALQALRDDVAAIGGPGGDGGARLARAERSWQELARARRARGMSPVAAAPPSNALLDGDRWARPLRVRGPVATCSDCSRLSNTQQALVSAVRASLPLSGAPAGCGRGVEDLLEQPRAALVGGGQDGPGSAVRALVAAVRE